MFKRRSLELENALLRERVHQLEELLCENNNHDYIIVEQHNESEFDGFRVNIWGVRRVQCTRCKRRVIDNNKLGEWNIEARPKTTTKEVRESVCNKCKSKEEGCFDADDNVAECVGLKRK